MRCVKRDAQRRIVLPGTEKPPSDALSSPRRPQPRQWTIPTATKPSTLVTFCTSTVEPVPVSAIGVVPLVVVQANVELTAPG